MFLITEQEVIDNPKHVENRLVEFGFDRDIALQVVDSLLAEVTETRRNERLNQSLAMDVAEASECPHERNALDEFEHGLNHGVEIGRELERKENYGPYVGEAALGSFAEPLKPFTNSIEQAQKSLALINETAAAVEKAKLDKAKFALDVLRVDSTNSDIGQAATKVILAYLNGGQA